MEDTFYDIHLHYLTNSFCKHCATNSCNLAYDVNYTFNMFLLLSAHFYCTLYIYIYIYMCVCVCVRVCVCVCVCVYTQVRWGIKLYVFVLHFAHWMSCCPHADHILPKLPTPDKRFSTPDIMVSTSDASNLLLCLSHFIFMINLTFSYGLNQGRVET
jgi:hypothetical protein